MQNYIKNSLRFTTQEFFCFFAYIFRPLFSSSVQETANSKDDDKAGNYTGPDINLARCSSDGVVLWDEALAREGIEDSAVWLQRSVASVNNSAWHRKGVGNIKPEDVQAV